MWSAGSGTNWSVWMVSGDVPPGVGREASVTELRSAVVMVRPTAMGRGHGGGGRRGGWSVRTWRPTRGSMLGLDTGATRTRSGRCDWEWTSLHVGSGARRWCASAGTFEEQGALRAAVQVHGGGRAGGRSAGGGGVGGSGVGREQGLCGLHYGSDVERGGCVLGARAEIKVPGSVRALCEALCAGHSPRPARWSAPRAARPFTNNGPRANFRSGGPLRRSQV